MTKQKTTKRATSRLKKQQEAHEQRIEIIRQLVQSTLGAGISNEDWYAIYEPGYVEDIVDDADRQFGQLPQVQIDNIAAFAILKFHDGYEVGIDAAKDAMMDAI